MTHRNIFLGASLALLVLAIAFVLAFSPHQDAHANSYTATNIGAVATTTATTAITTSARIMATTTNVSKPLESYTRVYASICNPNANPVYLNLDGDKPANFTSGNTTTVIAAAAGYNVCYEITDRNAYQGSVTASSSSETSTKITVKQYVQQ